MPRACAQTFVLARTPVNDVERCQNDDEREYGIFSALDHISIETKQDELYS